MKNNKYLLLKFKNAKLFTNKKSKDFIFELNNFRKRENEHYLSFKEPITVYQISNMIHVLFGERPVPSLRQCFYSKVDYLFEKAENSLLKISNEKFKKDDYQKELIRTKKAIYNSYKAKEPIYWERVYKLLEQEHFTYFIDFLTNEFGENPRNFSMNEVRDKFLLLSEEKKEELFSYLRKAKKTSLLKYLKENNLDDVNKNERTSLTIVNGIEKVITLNGEILIPVNDDDIEKIKKNKGCATILDGGMVYIVGIRSDNEIDDKDFIKVKNISKEKI